MDMVVSSGSLWIFGFLFVAVSLWSVLVARKRCGANGAAVQAGAHSVYREAAWVALLIGVSLVIAYFSLGSGFRFDVYPTFINDGISQCQFIKSIQENGLRGVYFNPRTGAPGESTLIDFPGVGYFDIFLYWALTWFMDNTAAISYVFYLISFVIDALAMWFLLKKLKIRNAVNFPVSILFAFAPFHFYRAFGHASLFLYFAAPLSIYLACYILGILKDEKRWCVALAAVLIGLGYGYYYAFSLMVIAVAFLLGLFRVENKKELLSKLWIFFLILAVVALGLLPKSIYSWINGPNLECGVRSAAEQELYGLKIIQLLLPVTYSRVEIFRWMTDIYMSSAPLITENFMSSLGMVGNVGFVVMCIAFCLSFASLKPREGDDRLLVDYISLMALIFILVGTVGGFGEIFNQLVTAQIRCYNRSSIFILALSLVMAAWLLEWLGRTKIGWLVYPLCVLVLGGGLFDQFYCFGDHWQDGVYNQQKMYEDYFPAVEEALPEGSMVYQLPYMEFPEAGWVHNVGDYKLYIGYLFTDNLRWSYGAVRGRNEINRALNIDEGMSADFLRAIREAGFAAVYIDTDGYEDGGAEILAFYNALGIEPLVSPDQKLYVYDITGLDG